MILKDDLENVILEQSFSEKHKDIHNIKNTMEKIRVQMDAVIKKLTAELALKSASDDLQADLTQGVVKEKVGVIEVEYNKNSPQSKQYPAIDFMLRPFLKPGSGCSIELVRT